MFSNLSFHESYSSSASPFKLDRSEICHSLEGLRNTSHSINPLPNDKILLQSKLKAFADNKLKVIQLAKFVMDKIENIVGKEENAGYQHFLLLPQCFQKAFSFGSLKVWIVW